MLATAKNTADNPVAGEETKSTLGPDQHQAKTIGIDEMTVTMEIVDGKIKSVDIESAPDPLTSRFPFRHDGRDGGKRGGAWAIHPPRRTAEFKQKAVELYRKSGTTYAEVARGLGCDAGSLSDWVRKADAAGPAVDGNPFQMAEDLRRLKRENERLKRESEILLKASAFFASRQL